MHLTQPKSLTNEKTALIRSGPVQDAAVPYILFGQGEKAKKTQWLMAVTSISRELGQYE